MKSIKSVVSCALLALFAAFPASVRAEVFDFTESWRTNLAGTVSVGKTFSVTMPEAEEAYYKLSGISSGNAYTFSTYGSNSSVEILYTYQDRDSESGDKYIYSTTIGSEEESSDTRCVYRIFKDSWEDDIDPDYKPTGYYLHVYGDEGATVAVSSSKGLVNPDRAGTVTVTIRGAADATWSLKGEKTSYTNGQTVAIMGRQTVTFPAMKGLTKPADRVVEPEEDGEAIAVTGVYGVALTLKGTDVTAEYGDESYEAPCSFTVVPGDEIKLSAPADYTDARDNAYLFQTWTPSTAYDFGEAYSAVANETTIAMPAAALTMTATFMKESDAAWMTIYAEADPVTAGEGEEATVIEPEEGDLLWSTDGKAWYASGTKVMVKKGSYTLKWKSASGSWDGPTAKTTVQLAAGDEYDNEENPAKFTFVTILCAEPTVCEEGELSESPAGGTVKMTPASGRIAPGGTAVTLTAKANAGYAFVGWHLKKYGDDLWDLSTQTTFKSTMYPEEMDWCLDEDDLKVHYQAVFRPVSDYSESDVTNLFETVSCGYSGKVPSYDETGLAGEVEVQVGLNCSSTVYLGCATRAQPVTFRLAGQLPAGMKFDSKTGYFTGTPTKVGTFGVRLTATDPAGHACTLAISIVVRPVLDSIVGNYRALLQDEDGEYAGTLEMSVTEKGKASAKIVTATGTTTLTPLPYWQEDEEDPDADGSISLFAYKIAGTAKSGSYVSFSANLSSADAADGSVYFYSSTVKNGEETSSVSLSGTAAYSDPSILADEDFADAFLGKYYTVQLAASVDATPSSRQSETATTATSVDATPSSRQSETAKSYRTPTELIAPGYLTLTTDRKGGVKVAGKLADGTAVSASTVLLTSTNASTASVQLFVVPSSYKKKGSVALQLDLSVDATPSSRLSTTATSVDATPSSRLSTTATSVDATPSSRQPAITSSLGVWTTPPLLDAIANHTPAEDDAALFLPGRLALAASGAEYSKLADLTDYYLSLCVTTNAVSPTLEYSYTDADKAKQYARANLALGSYTLGDDMLTGGTGGRITIEKSPSPWKDSDGVWHYDETREDAEGETQPITNPGSLTIAFNPATGIFTGKCNLFFDYEVPQYKNGEEIASKKEHKSVSCAYAGVVVLPIDDESETCGRASAVYAGKYTYAYETADARGNVKSATKTYTQNHALPVTWTLGE